MDTTDEEMNQNIRPRVLPPKILKPNYRKEKKVLLQWMEKKKMKFIDENTLLLYFTHKSKILKPPMLSKCHARLKRILIKDYSIDISEFFKLNAFVTQNLFWYDSKPILTFSKENITKFLTEAPDKDYLMMKVACIVGIAGACSRDEVLKITLDDVEEDNDTSLIFNIPDTNTGTSKSFTVIYGVELYRNYIALRLKDTPHRRLFVQYREEKCTAHAIGVVTYDTIPMKIAQFLNLPKPKQYTDYCFRDTSSKLLASGEFDFLTKMLTTQSSINHETSTD